MATEPLDSSDIFMVTFMVMFVFFFPPHTFIDDDHIISLLIHLFTPESEKDRGTGEAVGVAGFHKEI